MAEYYLKRLDPGRVEVAKFDGGDQPAAVYTMEDYPGGYICACPRAFHFPKRRDCKHHKMLKAFVEAGEPSPFIIGD